MQSLPVASYFRFSKLILVIVFVAGGYLLSPSKIEAVIDSCSGSLSPTQLSRNSEDTITFVVNNDSSEDAMYIKISSPNSYISITDAASSGWNLDYIDYTEIYMSGGSILAGESATVTITADISDVDWAAEGWQVSLDTDPEGSEPTICSGAFDTSIATSQALAISSVDVSNVTTSQATVTWTTNKNATSTVNYGTSASYGSTLTDDTPKTSHSITLTSLSANTTYHYKLTSVDEDLSSVSTGNSTFASAANSSSSSTSTTIIVNTTSITPAVVLDSIKPSVRVTTNFSKPFDKAPKIIGRATDDKSVVRIDYSIDNGVNWQPVDTASLNKTSINFEFTPIFLEDDTYKIKVRATDGGGNIGLSSVGLLTIDRLPPSVGSVFFSVGPQPLPPPRNGKIYGLKGMDQKITLSAIGGPTSVDIISKNKMFSLVKSVDNGLWSGVLSFENSGEYKLTAKSVDGGGTRVEREIGSIEILDMGKVVAGNSNSKVDATVSVYYFDYITDRFVLWDGSAYSQANPQITDIDGNYMLYLPPGKYFIEVKAPGYRNLKTSIFEIIESVPLTSELKLQKKLFFFDITETVVDIDTDMINVGEIKENNLLVGKQLTDVELFDGEKNIQLSSLRGKRMLISILNSWNPQSFAQMSILNSISKSGEIEVGTIFPQQTASKIHILKQKGAYKFPMLADPDGLLVDTLSILYLPMNLYISRNGTIESVTYGVLNSWEIEKKLLD